REPSTWNGAGFKTRQKSHSSLLRDQSPTPSAIPIFGFFFTFQYLIPFPQLPPRITQFAARSRRRTLQPPLPPSPFPPMLPYKSIEEAAAHLGRNLTYAETLWFNYSADKSDYVLFCHNILFLFLIFSVVPLPIVFIQLLRSPSFGKYKIQPKVQLSTAEIFKCYKDVMLTFFFIVGPLQLVSYPSVKIVGIHTGLPLPSGWEIAAQLFVYFVVEDYTNYWVHRFLHGKWGYENIHKVHHEYTAPIAFAAPYAHWAEILILGIPSFLGPAMVPGHMITFWLWIALRQMEAIDTHSGYACICFLATLTIYIFHLYLCFYGDRDKIMSTLQIPLIHLKNSFP
ncbi:unnamed protein product, partial [Linum tenue]